MKVRRLGHRFEESAYVSNVWAVLSYVWLILAMVRHCIAYGCSSRNNKAGCENLSWHSLPLRNPKLLHTWLVKIKRENTPVNKNSFLCSKHFDAECFVKSVGGKKVSLKPGSFPSKFVFTEEKSKRKEPIDRSKTVPSSKAVKRLKMPDNPVNLIEEDEHSLQQDAQELSEISDKEALAFKLLLKEKEILHLNEQCRAKENTLNIKVKELETALEQEREARKELEIMAKRNLFSIENLKNNDKLLRFYTGFENFELFGMVLDFLGREAASHLDYRNRERSATDSSTKIKPGPERTLSVENEFFMVLCRLKVGLLEEDLAARFGVSQSLVSVIVNTWIKFMFFRFKELDIFPSREIVQLHKPECFSKKYKSTTIIIDATEIYIEKPNNPEAQQLTFSSYKNTNTLKALVGIVPKGSLCFISELYSGCISEKEITQRSGLVDKLQHGDDIMADGVQYTRNAC